MDVYNSKGGTEEDELGYDNLCKYSIEKCELCDSVFSSRFANIIHCSQHIIIPLIKQKTYQCKKCLYYFTSKSDLKTHKQTKHKKKDVNTANNGQAEQEIDREESLIGQEESLIGQEGSPVGEVSLIGQEARQIGHKQSKVPIDHKKSHIDKRKRKTSHVDESQSHISHIDESQCVKESENEKEKNALLKSLITKQPIVKIEDIGNVVAILSTKNVKTYSKQQKETTITEKDKDKTQKVKKETKTLNTETADKNGSSNAKKVLKEEEIILTKNIKTYSKQQKQTTITEKDKDKTQKVNKETKTLNTKTADGNGSSYAKKVLKEEEIIFSRTKTSQDIITEGFSNKIIIGKRKSADKTDNDDKRQKKSNSTDATTEGDKTSKTPITNGIHTKSKEITDSPNRQSYNIREISPDIISLDSDSSDEPLSKTVATIIMPTAAQSVRKFLQISFEDSVKDQPKTAQQNGQSNKLQRTIKVPQKGLSKIMQQKNWSKNTQQKDLTKNMPQKEQSKNLQQEDWSKNAQEKDQFKTTTFLLTESDSEEELKLDQSLQSPIKTSDFRSKLQFEDDESEVELFEQPLLLKKKIVKPVSHEDDESEAELFEQPLHLKKKIVKPVSYDDLEKELANLSYGFKSVHYDELVEPELSECQRCHMIFMNRLALYKHETSHIRIRRPRKHYFCRYCESYFFGNHFTQKKHFDTVHNITPDKRAQYGSCPVCKLQYYKLKRHYQKYHANLICKHCLTCFGNEQVLSEHDCKKMSTLKLLPERKNPQETLNDAKNSLVSVFSDEENAHKQYDLLLVCDFCLSFIKITGRCTYEVVGEKSEVGERRKCFYCSKKFFALKIVKRVTIGATVASKIQNLKQTWKSEGKKVSKISQGSNALKLQSIQKRLKAMKQ